MSSTTSPRFAEARNHLAAIVAAALQAADPARCVRAALQRSGSTLRLPDGELALGSGRVWMVSVGKAAPAMAGAAAEILGPLLAGGLVIAKDTADPGALILPPNVQLHLAGHPVADTAGVAATRAAARMLVGTAAEDLVLCLISGGSSALLTDPLLPLAQWQALTRALLESGCDIAALNTVRRRLDRVKGGGLAGWAAPARCVGLILSDVVGNPLPAIGSGPTVPVTDPPDAALRILQQYEIEARLAPAAWAAVRAALQTPPAAPPPSTPRNYVVGDVALAALAAAAQATRLGFAAQLLTTTLSGEASDAGRAAAAAAMGAPAGACLLWAGETTVTVRGSGRGGRNQESVLAAVGATRPRPGARRRRRAFCWPRWPPMAKIVSPASAAPGPATRRPPPPALLGWTRRRFWTTMIAMAFLTVCPLRRTPAVCCAWRPAAPTSTTCCWL